MKNVFTLLVLLSFSFASAIAGTITYKEPLTEIEKGIYQAVWMRIQIPNVLPLLHKVWSLLL